MMASQSARPDWPRLMSIKDAAEYLGVSVNTFRALGICPLNIGRRVVYDRRSLDLYADQLSGHPRWNNTDDSQISDYDRWKAERAK